MLKEIKSSEMNVITRTLIILMIFFLSCDSENQKPNEEVNHSEDETHEEIEINDKKLIFLSFWEDMSSEEFDDLCASLVDEGILRWNALPPYDLSLMYKDGCEIQLIPKFENDKLKVITLKDVYCLYSDMKDKYELPPLVNVKFLSAEIVFIKNRYFDFKASYSVYENGHLEYESTNPRFVDKVKIPGEEEKIFSNQQIMGKDTLEIYKADNVVLLTQYSSETTFTNYSLEYQIVKKGGVVSQWSFGVDPSNSIIWPGEKEVIRSNSLHTIFTTKYEYNLDAHYYTKSYYDHIVNEQEMLKMNQQNQLQKLQDKKEQNNELIFDGL